MSENPNITKIVITGGPCAGKTTAMEHINNVFSKMGYTVLFVAETATELISGGISPWALCSNADYQTCQLKLQIAKERIFEEGAKKLRSDSDILIVCDRGIMDNRAYMTREDFDNITNQLNLTEEQINSEYGAVFHLVTAAKGATMHYTTANNAARTETIDEAITLDDKLISAWSTHPYHRIIDNSGSFEDKLERLIYEIKEFLKQ